MSSGLSEVRWIVASILTSVFFSFSAIADIQDAKPAKSFKPLPRPSTKKVQRILSVAPVEVEVIRGQSVMIPIEVSPGDIANPLIRILIPPKHGKLEKVDPIPGSAACFLYRHDGYSADPQDSFVFQAKEPLLTGSGRQTARIFIRKPQAEISIDPVSPIDFGKIPLGSRSVMDVRLSNSFGSTVEGTLSVLPPWSIEGDCQLRLPEGESTVKRLVFEPIKASRETCRIRVDSFMDCLPEVTLTGEGIEPFIISGKRQAVVGKTNPEASILLENSLDVPLTIRVSGIPAGISAPTRLVLPPRGSMEWHLSLDASAVNSETESKYPITFEAGEGGRSGQFHQMVDLVIRGPRPLPTLELLYGGEQSGCKVGETLRMEGIARNPSVEEWIVDLRLGALNGQPPSSSRLVIPSHGLVNFHYDWAPRVAGDTEVVVELREPKGRLLARKSWPVSALPAIASGATAPAPSVTLFPKADHPKETPRTKSAVDREIADQLVVDLKPVLQKGWLLNHASLTWRYLGSARPGFRIQILRGRNALADRTGEQDDHRWVDLGGVEIQDRGNGIWLGRLPFLMPGSYQLRVFPETGGDIFVSVLTMEISPGMVFWPPLRTLLVAMLLVLALREIRRRL